MSYSPNPHLAQNEQLIDRCLPVAGRLVYAVREQGPAEVRAVLASLPRDDNHTLTLLVLLAGMVDPYKTVPELIGWVDDLPPDNQGEQLRVAVGL